LLLRLPRVLRLIRARGFMRVIPTCTSPRVDTRLRRIAELAQDFSTP
jgi:acetolactate synthase regulatory subunit